MDLANLQPYLQAAIAEAKLGLAEGGIPIGAVLVDSSGKIVARGHNRRVQNNDPTSHGETDCIRNAGRRRDWQQLTLFTTLSPCPMCSGTALLFKIPHIVIGENVTYQGAERWLKQSGVTLTQMNDPTCIAMMREFIAKRPELWNEDIGIPS